ncbi:MAG TPA: thiamine phosphate synthase [Gemmatales bacterium]|nr:thiamine phosphate synthase [Gemmatales bacterium]
MLLPEMTPGAQRSVLAGLAWKRAMSSNDIAAEHLLLGLLHDEDARPAQLFSQQQLALPDVLRQLQLEHKALEIEDAFPVPLDSYVLKLLYDARRLSIDNTGSPEVHSEHLLLALIHDSAQVRDHLQDLGFQTQLLQDKLGASSHADLKLDEPIEWVDSRDKVSLARILDANANRAREALRVLEELCRFHLNDRFLAQLAKELRHELTQLMLIHLPNHQLLRSRDTEHDVGTQISTGAETLRSSLTDVQQANAQRLQEALRSLEEYGKVQSTLFGKGIEAIRYRSYTLEKALMTQQHSSEQLAQAQLYLLVSKAGCAASIEWTIQEAAAGGVGMVQMREKAKTDREMLAIGREVREATRKAGILFIMNDRPDIAKLVDADGVHLGQDDLDVRSARNILGAHAVIGISTHNLDQCKQAILDGADYIGVGPTFASQTKNFDSFAGLEFVQQVAEFTTLPAYAIGGITAGNVREVVKTGLRRVAVGHAISQAEEPRHVARMIKQQLDDVAKVARHP